MSKALFWFVILQDTDPRDGDMLSFGRKGSHNVLYQTVHIIWAHGLSPSPNIVFIFQQGFCSPRVSTMDLSHLAVVGLIKEKPPSLIQLLLLSFEQLTTKNWEVTGGQITRGCPGWDG